MHWNSLEATSYSQMVYWILGVVAGELILIFIKVLVIQFLMNVDIILCSVLKNISETIVALVTEEGNSF